MNMRALLVRGLLVGFGLYFSLGVVSSTHAQIGRWDSYHDDDLPKDLLPKVKFFERTDLFVGSSSWIFRSRFYREATMPSGEDAPLELFKMKLRASKSASDYIEAATQYLEAQSFTVTKKAADK